MLRDTSAIRATDRMLMPSVKHLMIRTFLRLARIFILLIIAYLIAKSKHKIAVQEIFCRLRLTGSLMAC